MIRLTFVLRRKPGMSFGDFQDYWLNQHGPLVASHATHLKILKYVQVHTITDPDEDQPVGPRGKMAKPYDGVAELWFESLEAIKENTGDDALAATAALLEDERQFIDHPHSPGWLNYECPQINPTPENILASPSSAINKFYYVLQPLKSVSFKDFQFYWRTHHGPLVRQVGPAIGAKKYIQVHRIEDEFNDAFAQSRGIVDPAFIGHAELWFDSTGVDTTGTLSPSPEAIKGGQLLYEDEAKIADFSRSAVWFGKEHVIVNKIC